jgi:hypothetical protein
MILPPLILQKALSSENFEIPQWHQGMKPGRVDWQSVALGAIK